MSQIGTSTEIDRDVTTVYDQWTRFEGFPRLTEGVERVVAFEPLGAARTRVSLQLDFEPQDAAETAADAMSVVDDGLEHFKTLIEKRGVEAGGYGEQIP